MQACAKVANLSLMADEVGSFRFRVAKQQLKIVSRNFKIAQLYLIFLS